MEHLKNITQYFREAIKLTATSKWGQQFFWCGKMHNFLHQSTREILQTDGLSIENDCEPLRDFFFASAVFLDYLDFCRQNVFYAKAVK